MNPRDPTTAPVPVVRLIVTDAQGRVLILQRRHTRHGDGEWCLPGGKVDYGDTVAEAACRELQEETGLDGRDARFLFYQDSLPLTPGAMHCINLYFACPLAGALVLNQESSAYRWISREELSVTPPAFRNGEGLARYWQRREC